MEWDLLRPVSSDHSSTINVPHTIWNDLRPFAPMNICCLIRRFNTFTPSLSAVPITCDLFGTTLHKSINSPNPTRWCEAELTVQTIDLLNAPTDHSTISTLTSSSRIDTLIPVQFGLQTLFFTLSPHYFQWSHWLCVLFDPEKPASSEFFKSFFCNCIMLWCSFHYR